MKKNKQKKHSVKKSRKGLSVKKKTPPKYIKSSGALVAPEDMRLIENPIEVLSFIKKVRSPHNYIQDGRLKRITISFENVKSIDHATLSIMRTVSVNCKADLKSTTIERVHYASARAMMKKTGFSVGLYDGKGRVIQDVAEGALKTFRKGAGRLCASDIISINSSVKETLLSIGFDENEVRKRCLKLQKIILEICGNAIEWGYSGAPNRVWIFGVCKNEKEAVFTVTDIGHGILETIKKDFASIIRSIFSDDNPVDILNRAFDKKYGSKSGDLNRNHGLPAIKEGFNQKIISKLYVISNDAFLDFENPKNSRRLNDSKFGGTFYQWSVVNENA